MMSSYIIQRDYPLISILILSNGLPKRNILNEGNKSHILMRMGEFMYYQMQVMGIAFEDMLMRR